MPGASKLLDPSGRLGPPHPHKRQPMFPFLNPNFAADQLLVPCGMEDEGLVRPRFMHCSRIVEFVRPPG